MNPPQPSQRFLIVKNLYPRTFRELSAELLRQIPQCLFMESEVGLILLSLIKGTEICGVSFRIVHDKEFSSLHALLLRYFVTENRNKLIEFYQKRRHVNP